MEPLDTLLKQIANCQICAEHLELGTRPVLSAQKNARVLIIGQAPGIRVHETGIPWNDESGNRLRKWMDVTNEEFYDISKIAIVPMGFCYPGRDKTGGDKPPRPECAPHWHTPLLSKLTKLQLTLLIGGYAQKFYLKNRCRKNMTETVRAWRTYDPKVIPTPHPSWRNTNWLKTNPWFKTEVLPELRIRVRELL